MKRSIAVLLALFTLTAGAQEFPTKPVRLVVPFPPGGPLDIAGRLIGKELQDRWGQAVIVENKPGSTIGPEYVVRSAPDGHVLLIISSTPLVTLPHLQKVPYDARTWSASRRPRPHHAFVVNSPPGSVRSRTDRTRQEGAGHAQLRKRRKRLRPASLRGAAEERGGHEPDARALQGRGARAPGGARGRA
jgi:hypothetical protein